ncbi:MAG TPA: glycosyltransferase [Acetobacteraceae bacterium]|nr:glycosyltransferase [Acetobacteraceae bacterium]
MKYLFVHQNFPGQYLHIVRRLAQEKAHDIVFISEPNGNQVAGVRKVAYQVPREPASGIHPDARDFEGMVRRAESVARTAANVKALGFTPDIIIGHHGWGELLNIQDVWSDVPVLGYHEFYYHVHGVDVGFDPEFPLHPSTYPRVRAKNAVNLLALTNPGHGQTPTEWQRSTYPDWARSRLALVPEGVDLAICRPDPQLRRRRFAIGDFTVSPRDKLLTYVARDLEPYRGFHVIMRALPRLLAARPELCCVLVGGEGVSYGARFAQGSWKEFMLREVGDRIDRDRVLFPGKIAYETYIRLLQRSDVHVYLTYPFVASWSLREALAAGCAVVGSDTPPVREFITDGENGLLTPCLDPEMLATRVLDLLEDSEAARRLRAGARRFAETVLPLETYLTRYQALIDEVIASG